MNRCLFSPQALADLQAVWDYIGIEQDNPAAADRQLSRLQERFAVLTAHPLMGQLREDLRPRLRVFTVDNYIILYFPTEDGIEVVGIVHAARHLEWLFPSENPPS